MKAAEDDDQIHFGSYANPGTPLPQRPRRAGVLAVRRRNDFARARRPGHLFKHGCVMLTVFLAFTVPRHAAARSGAPAKPLVVTLEYDVPETCPQVGEFKAIVVKRLGRDPFVEEALDRVSVVVFPTDDALTGKLVWRESAVSHAGEQTFPSKTSHCAEVIGAIGFALALQIQLLETDGTRAQESDGKTSELGSAPSTDTAPRRVPRSRERQVQQAVPEQRSLPPQVSAGAGAAVVSGITSR